jgi:hypothetical protein
MWPFTKKKEVVPQEESQTIEPPIVVKKLQFDLTIVLGCGKEFGYNQIHSVDSGKSCIGCFLPFYQWFYEKESPYYTFEHRQGADIFIRSEIKSIIMRKKEIEEFLPATSS